MADPSWRRSTNVSPETIRRALRLLADMKVVEVKPQSGVVGPLR